MRVALLLLAAAFLHAPFAAAQAEEVHFTLRAHAEGGTYFWTLEGDMKRNPDLVVPPNATVRVTLVNVQAAQHNLQVEGFPPSPYFDDAGATLNYTFIAPATGSLEYFCHPHKAAGMAGHVVVQGSEAPEKPAPAPPALVAVALVVVAALALRRR